MNVDTHTELLEWEVLFRELLAGMYADEVARFASCATVVRARFGRYASPLRAEAVARAALNSLLLQWNMAHVELHQRADSAMRLIDLIAELRPPRGVGALMHMLASSESWLEDPESYSSYLRADTPRFRALVALNSYFPTPAASLDAAPEGDRTGYAMYVQLLREHVGRTDCSVEAAIQLLLLGEIHQDEEWPSMLSEDQMYTIARQVSAIGGRTAVLEDLLASVTLNENSSAHKGLTRALNDIREQRNASAAQTPSAWGPV